MRFNVLVVFILASQANAASISQAPKSCPAALKNFPFLKPWVEKLDNFVAPYEVDSAGGSQIFAIGATNVGKNGADRWKTDSVTLRFDWKKSGASLETAWLGPQAAWPQLWSHLLRPMELELLSKCDERHCKIKFNDIELKALASISQEKKAGFYRESIQKRIQAFREHGQVFSYEGTQKPQPWKDFLISPLFSVENGTHFWLPKERNSFGYEMLDAEPGHHKPVTALFSRQCEKRGQGEGSYTACTDVVIYNNHYFDFWARIVLFFPWCDTEIALAYEAVDVDQLKSSRVARVFFGSEMRKLFGLLLETRLRRLHMLGSAP